MSMQIRCSTDQHTPQKRLAARSCYDCWKNVRLQSFHAARRESFKVPSERKHKLLQFSQTPYWRLSSAKEGGAEAPELRKARKDERELSQPEDADHDASNAEDKGVESALRALRWYKSTISPLLPRACRFLPTCSEYSMQAYKQFGVAKGTTLTAWRLIRCNPLNLKVRYQDSMTLDRGPKTPLKNEVPPICATRDPVLEALQRRGEDFLRLFDDYTEESVRDQNALHSPELCGEESGASQPLETETLQNRSGENTESEPPALSWDLDFSARRSSSRGASTSHPPAMPPSAEHSRKAKKLFLAGKLSQEESEEHLKTGSRHASDQVQQGGPTAEQFREMQREVGALGALGLSRQQQKSLEKMRLEKLHFRPEKGIRTPANIGKQVVAKRVAREKQAFEEGVESGMIQLRGSGKKKQRQKQREHRNQPGLNEDKGAFRNGVLNLNLMKRRRPKVNPTKRKLAL